GFPPPLQGKTDASRVLVDAVVERELDHHVLWWIAHHTPSLLSVNDFPWLMQRCVDSSRPIAQRRGFAELSRTLRWYDDQRSIESWLAVREHEPIASIHIIPLMIQLDSKAADEARKLHLDMNRSERKPVRSRIEPAPAERVQQVLALTETKDPQFFLNLCSELTLEEFSSHYTFARFLTNTAGWATAGNAIRSRIIDAAKRLLTAPTTEPEDVRAVPLSAIRRGYMSAIFLIAELDLPCLVSRAPHWCTRWAWYILRELHLHMHGEKDEVKMALTAELHRR